MTFDNIIIDIIREINPIHFIILNDHFEDLTCLIVLFTKVASLCGFPKSPSTYALVKLIVLMVAGCAKYVNWSTVLKSFPVPLASSINISGGVYNISLIWYKSSLNSAL